MAVGLAGNIKLKRVVINIFVAAGAGIIAIQLGGPNQALWLTKNGGTVSSSVVILITCFAFLFNQQL
jgi:hypothetical protein